MKNFIIILFLFISLKAVTQTVPKIIQPENLILSFSYLGLNPKELYYNYQTNNKIVYQNMKYEPASYMSVEILKDTILNDSVLFEKRWIFNKDNYVYKYQLKWICNDKEHFQEYINDLMNISVYSKKFKCWVHSIEGKLIYMKWSIENVKINNKKMKVFILYLQTYDKPETLRKLYGLKY